jgi:Lysine 2,3-aminomutase
MNIKKILEYLEVNNYPEAISLENFNRIQKEYPVLISRHLEKKILEGKHGLIKQFIPTIHELDDEDGAGAFFVDEKHITETMVQKYPNRCIIYSTSSCFSNCRHCSRKEKWNDNESYSRFEFDKSYLSILEKSYIEEVIITGGDALAIPISELDYMLDKLSNIEHVRCIRIGTRAFTSNPDVVSSELCEVLQKYKSTIICTQFNHPDEFTPETIEALSRVQKTGIPILNQFVLLKGINDEYHTVRELLAKCAENRVVPYYMFHCFKVKGVQCFRTDVQKGIDITNQLVGNVGGWWIPRYILIPHTTGTKVPVCPNGIVEWEDDLVLRDYKGREIKYY